MYVCWFVLQDKCQCALVFGFLAIVSLSSTASVYRQADVIRVHNIILYLVGPRFFELSTTACTQEAAVKYVLVSSLANNSVASTNAEVAIPPTPTSIVIKTQCHWVPFPGKQAGSSPIVTSACRGRDFCTRLP